MYGGRIFLELPRPIITTARLREILAPSPGERLLEVGPGTGYYTLDVARELGSKGVLEAFDKQPKMLDRTMRRAYQAGLTNIFRTSGDARKLPYPENHFDGAFLVTALGEIPMQDQALAELQSFDMTAEWWSGSCSGTPTWSATHGWWPEPSGWIFSLTSASAVDLGTSPGFG